MPDVRMKRYPRFDEKVTPKPMPPEIEREFREYLNVLRDYFIENAEDEGMRNANVQRPERTS